MSTDNIQNHTWHPFLAFPDPVTIPTPDPDPFGPQPDDCPTQVWNLFTANYKSYPRVEEILAHHKIRLSALHGTDDLTPNYYFQICERTKEFIAGVEEIARRMGEMGMEGGLAAGALLIDFSVHVLRKKELRFHVLLNSQRLSIYQLLDTALLSIILSAWESTSPSEHEWPDTIHALASDIAKATSNIPAWGELDAREMTWTNEAWEVAHCEALWTWYFARSRKCLEESLEIYGVRRKVNVCVQGRLPVELVDEIVDHVLDSKGLPRGRLRLKYFPKGKGKMVDTEEY